MNLRKLLAVSASAALLAGCGLLSRNHPAEDELRMSDHTIQELCDSAKQFFVTRAGTGNLRIGPGVGGKTLTDKIGGGNGCFYDKDDGSASPNLGSVSLFRVVDDDHTLSKPPPTNENYPTKLLAVDGITVKVVTEPLPAGADPAGTPLTVDLTTSIDGWDGALHFRATENETSRDDRTVRAGGQVLVNMVRALKG
ncbi:hypothetical protein ACFWF7_04270 [Nocardia sp. NPDC060256]|uniref:hypothetical protein n=1 Tax=unclassified Nocardia TaxID=2637762 RepID=UPI0036528071